MELKREGTLFQQERFSGHTEGDRVGEIARIIGRVAGIRPQIIITDNRVSMLSYRKTRQGLTLRLQRIFLEAPSQVIEEVGRLISSKRRIKTPLVNEFIKRNAPLCDKKNPKISKLNPYGRVFNLKEIFEKLNKEYFGGTITAHITWGSARGRHSGRRTGRKTRNRTLGSYNHETGLIRINPILDSKGVPGYFVEYIVYHEMLHAKYGIRIKNGRRVVHPPEFRAEERSFRWYEEARKWERRLI